MKLLFFMILAGLISCAGTPVESKHKMNQLQLQEQMQRFYTRFTERLVEKLTATLSVIQNAQLSETSYRQYLLYDSEALKIVTGPYPEINMLDMLVFVKLSKAAVKEYWIPKVYHQSGKGLLDSFEESEADIEKLAGQLISKEQLTQVDLLVDKWRKEHSKERRVEKIRLGEFSEFITQSKEAGHSEGGFSFGQMIVDTQSAISAVDDMVLVANRGMFLVQQLPFLVRLHARILAMEMTSDFDLRFHGSPMMQAQQDMNPGLVAKLESIIDGAYQAMNFFREAPKLSVWFFVVGFLLLVFIASAIFWGIAWLFNRRLVKH